MKAGCCQSATRTPDKAPRPASRWRRPGEFFAWLLPATILILLPKCPVCVAAYIALFSGVGISITSASILRTSLIVICITALLGLATWRITRRGKSSTQTPSESIS